MKRRYIVRRAAKNLRHAKMRTFLTSMAIAVGAFVLTLAFAAGDGARQYVDKVALANINPQSLLVMRDQKIAKLVRNGGGALEPGLREYDPNAAASGSDSLTAKRVTQQDIESLQQRGDLARVLPGYAVQAKYVTFEGFPKKYVASIRNYGYDTTHDILSGSLPGLYQDIGMDEVVLPEAYADTLTKTPSSLFGKKLKVTLETVTRVPDAEALTKAISKGDTAAVRSLVAPQLKTEEFTIRAITKKAPAALQMRPFLEFSADRMAEMYTTVAKNLPDYQRHYVAEVLVKQGVASDNVKSDLEKQGFAVLTPGEVQETIFQAIGMLQNIVLVFSVITVLASVFGIINTQYISVLERTRQIGLMKALGMSSREVARLFRYEAAWIGFLGGVIGSGTAWVAGTVANPWIVSQLGLGEGNVVFIFTPLPVVGMIVALVIVAILAGYLPARKAARLDPIEALRTE